VVSVLEASASLVFETETRLSVVGAELTPVIEPEVRDSGAFDTE
jgi:hypothetical protein